MVCDLWHHLAVGASDTGKDTVREARLETSSPDAAEVTSGEEFPESGRPDSNRRRPAWEAGILPLNYARGRPEILGPARGESSAYLRSDASRKLRRSGSLTAGSPGATLLSFPSRIHRSSSPTSSKR